nr:altered inheritance of mitochondria protein 24, mitochondrial [Quercus suber]
MRRRALDLGSAWRVSPRLAHYNSRRHVQISATPSSNEPRRSIDTLDGTPEIASGPLADFGAQAVSTLSILEPFRRAVAGIPFLYQRVISTTPFTALISAKSPITSLVVVHLDGRLDWMIAQRRALLAWTGHTLSLSPRLNTKMVHQALFLSTSIFTDWRRALHIGATHLLPAVAC